MQNSDNDGIDTSSPIHSEILMTDRDSPQAPLLGRSRKPLFLIILCVILGVFLIIGIAYFVYSKQLISSFLIRNEGNPLQSELEKHEASKVTFPVNIGRYVQKDLKIEEDGRCDAESLCMKFSMAKYESPEDVIIINLTEISDNTERALIDESNKKYNEYMRMYRFSLDGVLFQNSEVRWRNSEKSTIIISHEKIPYEIVMSGKYSTEFEKTGVQPSVLAERDRGWTPLSQENEVVAYFLKNYPSFDSKENEVMSFFPEKIDGFSLVKSRARILPRCPVLMDFRSIQPCKSSMEAVYQDDINKRLGILVGFMEMENSESIEKLKSTYFDNLSKISISHGKLIIPGSPAGKYEAIVVGAVVLYSDVSEIDDVEILYENNPVLKFFTEKYSSK